ncbi:MAG: hypothetical protein J6J60_00305 [Clostridia bacterium]|nr:hypothetical protein [Clostridia bacterium]
MFKNKRIYVIPAIGFLIIILLSSLVLTLPISQKNPISFFDTLFVATSAFSGTGFSTFNILENLTLFGQIMLLLTVQIGTLGFMIFFAFILSIRHKKIKLSNTLILSNEINFDNYTKVSDRTSKIIKYTFVIEFFGAMLLAIKFVPDFGIIKGIWYGIFHSISAFCNAGFDLLGNNSFASYTNDIYINIILIGLMLLGGLGYFVLEDIVQCIKDRKKHLQVHSKIILVTSVWLIFISTILFKIFSPNVTILQALFNTVTARNTGFASIDFSLLDNASKMLILILMFIGGAAGSSAGGIKLTTLAIIILFPISVVKGEDIIVFFRKIDSKMIRRAYTIFSFYVFLTIIGFFILLETNSNISSIDLLFELISAFSNTGVGTFDINLLNKIGKSILILYMYIGRLGPITLFTLFSFNHKKSNEITYVNADLML